MSGPTQERIDARSKAEQQQKRAGAVARSITEREGIPITGRAVAQAIHDCGWTLADSVAPPPTPSQPQLVDAAGWCLESTAASGKRASLGCEVAEALRALIAKFDTAIEAGTTYDGKAPPTMMFVAPLNEWFDDARAALAVYDAATSGETT